MYALSIIKYAATKAQLEKQLAQLRKDLKVPDETPARFYGNQGLSDGTAPKKAKQGKKQQ